MLFECCCFCFLFFVLCFFLFYSHFMSKRCWQKSLTPKNKSISNANSTFNQFYFIIHFTFQISNLKFNSDLDLDSNSNSNSDFTLEMSSKFHFWTSFPSPNHSSKPKLTLDFETSHHIRLSGSTSRTRCGAHSSRYARLRTTNHLVRCFVGDTCGSAAREPLKPGRGDCRSAVVVFDCASSGCSQTLTY